MPKWRTKANLIIQTIRKFTEKMLCGRFFASAFSQFGLMYYSRKVIAKQIQRAGFGESPFGWSQADSMQTLIYSLKLRTYSRKPSVLFPGIS